MITVKHIQNEVKTLFIQKTKETMPHATDSLLSDFSFELQKILHATFIGFYIYNEWDCSYSLVASDDKDRIDLNHIHPHIEKIEQLQLDGQIIDDERFFSINRNDQKIYILRLNIHDKSKSIYFICQFANDNKNISSEILQFVNEEMERYIQIFTFVKENNWKQQRNELLNTLATKIYATPNRSKVLQLIVEHLKIIYPTLQYNILLSQDYENNCTLPVKELELSQGVKNSVSDQAFLSGEVQIENEADGTNLYAPLKGNQGVYGVIQIKAPYKKHFPKREVNFITKLATTAGQALENVTLYQNSITLVEDLKLINNVTQQLNANVDLSKLISIVKQHIIEASHADEVGFIYINEENSKEFNIEQESTHFFKTEEGFHVLKYLLDKVKIKNEVFTGNFSKYYDRSKYESVMFIPMTQSGQILGGVAIMHKEKSYFSFDNFKLIESLIQHFTLAITNTVLKNKLEKAVITDYLTKLYARNHLDRMIKRHMEKGEYGTLILFDIDDFKKINDRYGHFIGDEVIIQVANIMIRNISENDIPTRWGGEELAIYLPNATLQEGLKIAEKIRKQVEGESEPQVTLSCGISTWSYTREDAVSDLFIRADQTLYAAKSAGKNQITTELGK